MYVQSFLQAGLPPPMVYLIDSHLNLQPKPQVKSAHISISDGRESLHPAEHLMNSRIAKILARSRGNDHQDSSAFGQSVGVHAGASNKDTAYKRANN